VHSAFGIDLDAPFADVDLVACAFQIPDRLKIRATTQKYIQREALKDFLPPSIRRRGKSLNRLLNDVELAGVMDGLADDLLSPAAVLHRGIFNPAYVTRLRRRAASAPYPEEQLYRLWTMLLIELWFRIFIDQRGAFPKDVGDRVDVLAGSTAT
jgi:asparagine synthase (glutamine-hydrolysing)